MASAGGALAQRDSGSDATTAPADAQAAAALDNAWPAASPASTPAGGVLLAGNEADALSDASATPGAAASPAPARLEGARGSTAQVDLLCRTYPVRLSSHRCECMDCG